MTDVLLIILSLLVATMTFVIVRVASRSRRPVERLAAAAAEMAAGNLAVAVPQESGDLAGLARALGDVREQMRVRLDELDAERRNLRTVLDGLRDAVFFLQGERVVFANSAAGELFRAPHGGWRDTPLPDAGFPASVCEFVVASMDTDESSSIDWGPDPTGRTLRISVQPLNRADTHQRAIVVVSDTTERTRLERVRRDFVANASHELKTPAAAIHLLAESATHAARAGETDVALAFAVQIEQESARLARLVTDLLDLSRLEATVTSERLTDVREAVGNATLAHGRSANEAGLDLVTDLSPVDGLDVFARIDPTDLAVALDNLLDNAIAYTEHGAVTVRVESNHDVIRVRVSDTGVGIPADDLPRIFERFFRVDRARSRRTGGTGLGLALVRHVVERANGTVEVDSEVGLGTTFTVTLPRA
ncbi:MAG TPA: ATP-binding protein [Coriobacteriia bacterium]|nr:ATP-binding protein [Coriobacteriia bacterium]